MCPVQMPVPGIMLGRLLAGPADIMALNYNRTIKIMLSPWTAPAWMKDSNSIFQGKLREELVRCSGIVQVFG